MTSRTVQATAWILSWILVTQVAAEVPQHSIVDGEVRLDGVGPDNPIIYDNDWWYDVFDNNYLWAQASLGKANLRGTSFPATCGTGEMVISTRSNNRWMMPRRQFRWLANRA